MFLFTVVGQALFHNGCTGRSFGLFPLQWEIFGNKYFIMLVCHKSIHFSFFKSFLSQIVSSYSSSVFVKLLHRVLFTAVEMSYCSIFVWFLFYFFFLQILRTLSDDMRFDLITEEVERVA